MPYFNSKSKIITNNSEIHDLLQLSKEQILNFIAKWISEGSGWTIESVDSHHLNIVQFEPIKASSYIKLPTALLNCACLHCVHESCMPHACHMHAVHATCMQCMHEACMWHESKLAHLHAFSCMHGECMHASDMKIACNVTQFLNS